MRKFICLLSAAFLLISLTAYARPFSGRVVQLPLQKIAPGESRIEINFELPENHEFALEAPSTILARFKHSSLAAVIHEQTQPVELNLAQLPYALNLKTQAGQTIAAIDMKIHFCDKDTKICLTENVRVKFPLEITETAPSSLTIQVPLCSRVVICPETTTK